MLFSGLAQNKSVVGDLRERTSGVVSSSVKKDTLKLIKLARSECNMNKNLEVNLIRKKFSAKLSDFSLQFPKSVFTSSKRILPFKTKLCRDSSSVLSQFTCCFNVLKTKQKKSDLKLPNNLKLYWIEIQMK